MKQIIALFLCFCTVFSISENCFADRVNSKKSVDFEKIDKIHCGMSKEEVLRIMGEPDSSDVESKISQCLYYNLSSRNQKSKYFIHLENGIVDLYSKLDNFDKGSSRYEFYYHKKNSKNNECYNRFYVLDDEIRTFRRPDFLQSFDYKWQSNNMKASDSQIKKIMLEKDNKGNLLHPHFVALVPLMIAIAQVENISDLNILYKKALAAKKA